MAYDALIQGILGAVMGGAQSGVHSIDEEEKARRLREERAAKLKDEMTLHEKKLEQEANRKRIEAELERKRLGSISTEVEASLPTGKPAWESKTKQGDAIDAGEVSEVNLSEAEKSRRRIEEYSKRGERGLVKEEMDKLEKERRFAADEAKERNTEERNRLLAEEGARRAEADRAREADRDRRFNATIAGLIGPRRGDGNNLGERRFGEQQWSKAKEELTKSLVTYNDMTQKDEPDHTARALAVSAMNRIKSAGDIDPADAAVAVSGIVSRAASAARDAAKGDKAKYEKFLRAAVETDLEAAFKKPAEAPKTEAKSAPSNAPKAEPEAPKVERGPQAPVAKKAEGFSGAYAAERQAKQQEINATVAAAQTPNLKPEQRAALADRLRQLQGELEKLNRQAGIR